MSRDPTTPRARDLDPPWYATGRLDAEATARIDAALADDPVLSRQVGLARHERDETVALNEALGVPSAAARRALFARIDADTARQGPLRRLLGSVSAGLSRLSPRTLAAAALTAAAVILVQAALLSMTLRITPDTHYMTASAPGSIASAGETALVGFVPTATTAAVTALLDELQASIVSGPRPGGLFEIRIADHRLSAPDRERAIRRLGDRTDVIQFVLSENGTK